MTEKPTQEWWTPAELADSGLPDMPGSVRGVNLMADRARWRADRERSRRKAGRGGGWQFHWTLLPLRARRALLRHTPDQPDPRPGRGEAWAEFDALPASAREEAEARLEVIQTAERLYAAGLTLNSAVIQAAGGRNVSGRTVWNWFNLIEGIPHEDRLPYLAPRRHFRKASEAATSAPEAREFLDYLKSLYLRLERPTFSHSYRLARKQAERAGWEWLTERTARRRLMAEVPRVTQVFARQGATGLQKCFPAQIRDRSGLHALEGVNADCHKIDVFVRWPDGTIARPQIVAFQDIYSGKVLSWRVDHDPNKVMVMAAFGEMVEDWGIPRRCLFDNGHEFANKWMTAGAPTRFRFKIRDDDPLGVLPLLGVQIHWATPAHGQAKPVERAFRDLASDVAKDPRFHGAYVGNRPDAKPENYGSRAVPYERFLQVLAEGIEEHNARDGRLSPTCKGRSFDATFAESYATAPIRKATEAQRRLWLMGQHVGQLHRDHGALTAFGNRYFSDWMTEHAGTRVVARFDPEDLHGGLWVYAEDGRLMGFAECQQKVGFFDLVGAKEEARRRSRIRRAERALLDAHRPVSMGRIEQDLDAAAPRVEADLTAKVVSPIFRRTVETGPQPDPERDALREAMILRMPDRDAKAEQPAGSETPQDRFRRAREILARSEAGMPVGAAEARWVAVYQTSAEFEGMQVLFDQFGEDGVG